MRAKHIHVEADTKILAEIRKRVDEELVVNKRSFRFLLFLKLICYSGTSILFFYGLFVISNSVLSILCYTMMGISLLLLAFNFAHDLSHNTVFKSKKLNNLGFIMIYTLVGAHAEAWRDRHVKSHHFAPNVKEYDSDLQITNLIRVAPDMNYKWFHRFQHIYAPFAYSSYSLYWIFIKDFVLLFRKWRKDRLSLKYTLSFIIQKIFYFSIMLIIPVLFTGQKIGIILLGFLFMHLVQSVFLLFTFFMTHHVEGTIYPETDDLGVIQTSWLKNQVLSSNDMHPFSKSANFLLGGFNNHIAHHLFPHIHHIQYPKLNTILYRVLINNGIIPNQTTYFGGIISHLRLLKTLSMQ